ncbi:MAG: c-type cytochrome [Nitrospirae bacterium]|nr:c-type cytochrome [Nitrospirota bacterium]
MRNRFYLWLLLISGVVLLAYLTSAAYREMSPEWKKYQAEYRELLIKNAKASGAKNRAMAPEIKVQQIYLGGLKRVERCTSCHAGIENPLMKNEKVPLRQHSGDYLKNHPVEKFGCTVCHYGQGRATNSKEAHGVGHETHWDYPIIPLSYIQSSCVQCHDLETLQNNGSEEIAQGEMLFREKGCKGCHKLNGAGGVLGKALDGVGSQPIAYFPMAFIRGERNVYSWLKEHFDDPRNIVPGSEMKSDFTDREADLLTTYVLSLRSEEMPGKYRLVRRFPDIEIRSAGGEALYRMYCIACHTNGKDSVNDEVFKRTIPAIMNPAFLKAVDNRYLKKVIEEGRAGTQMTAWKSAAAGLADREIDKVISYITRERPHGKPETFGIARYKGDAAHGEELYKIRCVSCHGAQGEGGVGLNLRNPVVQKNADPEFLAITVRDGRTGTHMAAFGEKGVGLSNQDIADVVTFVRALASRK